VLRVTCDTNIFISGLNFRGNPRRVLEMAADGHIHLSVSDDILNEIEEVLRRPKFGWSESDIVRSLKQIVRFTKHVKPKYRIDAVEADPDDNRILECAIVGKSEYLVTGDDHLLDIGQFRGIKIVTPADLLGIQAGASLRKGI
jgi:putative PIN family toxin of toxin-antitoxin system